MHGWATPCPPPRERCENSHERKHENSHESNAVRIYTAHLRARSTPVIVREGFAFWALVFGPLWLLARGAWIPAVLLAAYDILVAMLLRGPDRAILLLAGAVLAGLCARDMLRWTLDRRGFLLAHVLAAPDADAAYARLLATRPELIATAGGI